MRPSPWGLPTLAPEALLFYKGISWVAHRGGWLRERDAADLEDLVPHLADNEGAWLREVLSVLRPNHPWLLAEATGSDPSPST